MYRPRQPRQRWDSRMNLALALLPLLLLSGAAFSTDEGAASSTASGKDENILTLLSTNTTDLHDSFGTDGREAADGTAATALPSPQSTPSETSNSIGDESLSTNFTILDSDVVWIPNPGRHPTSPERDERVSGAADTIPTPAPTSTGNASFPSSELKPQTQNQTKSDSENSNKATVDEALQRLASEVYVPNGSPASRYATLKNRIAKAQLSSREGDVALGEVTFDWCHNNRLQDESYPSVLVHVNFRNFNCSFGWGARRSPDEPENRCAYQISQEGVKRPDNGGACSAYSKVYDPMRAAVQKGGQESDIDLILEELFGEPRDKCDSTHNSNKLHSCPVGSLSRTHGTSLMYYDRTLGVQNDIIGRTFLLVSSTNTSSFDYALSCSPIAFWDNCEISEKRALLNLKASSNNNDQLSSWTPRGDMCSEYEGVTCDDDGHVIKLLLPYPAYTLGAPKKPSEGAADSSSLDRKAASPLQGSLPVNFGELMHLQELDLSGQELNGGLPSWNYKDGPGARIKRIILRGNQLTGSIPESWTTLKHTEEINLSGNNLQGSIPPGLLELPNLRLINATSNGGICGTFQINSSSFTIALDDCKNSPPTPRPSPVPDPIPLPAVPFHETNAFVALTSTFVPALFMLSFSISCYAFVMFKRRRRLSETGASSAALPMGKELANLNAIKVLDGNGDLQTAVYSPAHGSDCKVSVFTDERFGGKMSTNESPLTCSGSDANQNNLSSPIRRRLKATPSTPATPALKTRCPTGYSPLDFACLPPEIHADPERILGSGGYGVVYYGVYENEAKECLPSAIKVISNSDYDEAHKSKFKTFKDEVEMLSLFKGNDCIVQVYTYCLDFPRAYIIYEYLPNDTLARSIHGKLVRQSYLQILQIGYGIAEGLNALHQQHVIHRDLKPDNILLDGHMRPKLSDFGISRKKDAAVSAMSTQNLGTWSYMAPEQFHGKVSEKSDIYAVGLILWECWTLRRPWDVSDDRDVWGVVFSIISDHKRPEIPPDCPKSLEALLVDCWNSDPKKRPTALELKSRVWKIMTVQSRRKVPPKELNEPPKGSTDVDSSMALADSMDDSSHDPARSSKIEIALPAKNR